MTFIFRIEYRDGTAREYTTSEASISLALEYVNKVIVLDAVDLDKPKPLDSIVSITILSEKFREP